jgi:hypothetical protein
MPDPDPKVTVPSDEEIENIASFLDLRYDKVLVVGAMCRVRDRTREATRLDVLRELEQWCQCGTVQHFRRAAEEARK